MKAAEEKSIRFPVAVHEKLKKLALKLGRSQLLVFTQMVDYFYSTKKDPTDINDAVLKNTLLKQHKEIIGFIRTQDNLYLMPMKMDMERLIKSQSKILDSFREEVLKANANLLQKQQSQTSKFTETDHVLRVIAQKLDMKEKLKEKFLYILNQYIHKREQRFVLSGKQQDDLVSEARQQVANL